ncbi:MAG: YiiX family permuted papain-like enzyme [Bacteroidetes bacterium]|nr:YiiX family permuted papain-like enzyme [Bacteroidota bacterium]
MGGFGLFVLTIRMMVDKPKEFPRTVAAGHEQLQSGDIIFQTSKSMQSNAIQLATKSKYSHMGVIYEIDEQFFVYEAIQPVQLTGLEEWIKRGEGSHFVVKRLKDYEKILTNENQQRLKDFGEKFKGKDYDIYFEWSDDKIYCSELVWKMYKEALGIEIGELQELKDFDLTSDVVKKKMRERYGDKIPVHEKVISPAAMFESDKLVTIREN